MNILVRRTKSPTLRSIGPRSWRLNVSNSSRSSFVVALTCILKAATTAIVRPDSRCYNLLNDYINTIFTTGTHYIVSSTQICLKINV